LKVASFIVARLSSVHSSTLSASRRWPLFAAAIAAVVALHVLVLVAWTPAWIDPEEPPSPPPVLAVRSVALAPVPVPAAVVPAPVPAAAPAPPAAPKPAPKVVRAPLPPKPAASVPVVQDVAPPPVDVAAAPLPAVVEPAAVAVEPAAAPTIDVPVYATRLPAPGSWRYALSRGIASGEAQLNWRPDTAAQRYEMRLEGFVAGLSVLDWVSTGALDAAGIAPERFVIRRRGRDSQAANFQRDAGKITWSGPTHEVPIVPGVQDRLSWMVQLPAVIEAEPQRFGAGTNVVLMVVGARGGADVWTFRVAGPDTVEGTPALKLVREARKPRDVHVEVWLDPARGHIPLRALLTQPDGGAPFELVLQPGSTGP
jgi:hypothetical protein